MKTSLFRLRHCNLHGMFYHELYYCRFFSQIVWYEVLVCNHVISRQCWGSIEFFFSVNLHYSRVLISSQKREMLLLLTTNMAAVTSRANHQRHQLRINKAANSSRAPTRQSNFCHSNNYLLYIPPPPPVFGSQMLRATYQPQPRTRVLSRNKRDNPGNEVGQPAIAIESRYM